MNGSRVAASKSPSMALANSLPSDECATAAAAAGACDGRTLFALDRAFVAAATDVAAGTPIGVGVGCEEEEGCGPAVTPAGVTGEAADGATIVEGEPSVGGAVEGVR